MSELRPYPFAALITRMFGELEAYDRIFDLPARKFFLGSESHDLSVRFHDQVASSPLGPAAGPQSQMAQNIVLSWLGGCRILELKTVQILDELEIPRPCIDMQTVGFNVEWSQELKLEQSLEEYVKGAMLVEMLRASGKLDLAADFGSVIYDMSVGYDLAGIQNPRVLEFIRGMQDAGDCIEHLRSQIPDEFAHFRDLDYPRKLSNTLTLSTFHGCPPDEIEGIIDFLLRQTGLNCIVKLNPTLLGKDEARHLLNDALGYEDLIIPDSAFDQDTTWEQAQGLVERLGQTADQLGLGFGVKFTNTLIVENHRSFFPAEEKQMYLSGQPLHVLAMHLVRKFRRRFEDRYPISFSAGIDRPNFADAVGLGLVPVTVCSDLLRPGGYGRAESYFRNLTKRMDDCGAADLDEWILRGFGNAPAALDRALAEHEGDTEDVRARCHRGLASPGRGTLAKAAGPLFESWLSHARLLNTESYVSSLAHEPRYAQAGNVKVPRKIGSHLELFDCITCDKCVPVCPNDANFTFTVPATQIPVTRLRPSANGWSTESTETISIEMKHQIANFADFCNECGNCDIFCPEDGGPYVVKPRFFGSLADWNKFAVLDGFFLEQTSQGDTIHGRFEGSGYYLERRGSLASRYSGPGFVVQLDSTSREPEVEAFEPADAIDGTVDLTYLTILELVRDAVWHSDEINYLSALYRT